MESSFLCCRFPGVLALFQCYPYMSDFSLKWAVQLTVKVAWLAELQRIIVQLIKLILRNSVYNKSTNICSLFTLRLTIITIKMETIQLVEFLLSHQQLNLFQWWSKCSLIFKTELKFETTVIICQRHLVTISFFMQEGSANVLHLTGPHILFLCSRCSNKMSLCS